MIDDIRQRLAAYRPMEMGGDNAQPRAAVLVPLYYRGGDLHVVLTKRTDRVANHRGEICFPGGAWEMTDFDLMTTALRECNEEIGLCPDDVDVLGRVDDMLTVSSFHVTPFVGAIDPAVCPYLWALQEREVAEVLEVPVSHLLDPANLMEYPVQRNGALVVRPGISFNGHVIWGATQRMLQNFLDVAVTGRPSTTTAPYP